MSGGIQPEFLLEQKAIMLKRLKLQRLRDDLAMAEYRNRPDLWLAERFGEDIRSIMWDRYEGYDGHSWDGDPNPLYTAWQALADGYNVGVESATSTGKTYSLARIVYWFLDCFENPFVVTVAPKEAQLKLHLWSEISRSWAKFLAVRPHAILNSLKLRKDVTNPQFWESAEAVGFVAGVGTAEESATKAQGFHRENMLIIIEETPGVNPAIIKAFENTITGTNNFIFAVGNPDNIFDGLHSFATSPGVRHVRISGYDHPNYVLRKEVVPGAVTVRSVHTRRLKYGEESAFYKSRVRGISPEQAVNSLIQLKWLEAAFNDIPIPEDNSYNAVGVDVANSEEGDKAALAWGRNNVLSLLQEFQCPNANHIAYNMLFGNEEVEGHGYYNYHTGKVHEWGIYPRRVGIDAVGVGAATVNSFIDAGWDVVSLHGKQLDSAIFVDEQGKPLYAFTSRRAQMFWDLREDLRQGAIKIWINDPELERQLSKELLAHQYETKAGKIAITKKEDVKKLLGGKSPNLADAVAYWNHVRKGYYDGGEYTPVAGG